MDGFTGWVARAGLPRILDAGAEAHAIQAPTGHESTASFLLREKRCGPSHSLQRRRSFPWTHAFPGLQSRHFERSFRWMQKCMWSTQSLFVGVPSDTLYLSVPRNMF
uniref:Uncharacterized protein n=1 Tax=Alexandrium monilatum TaxID=311494 RepID=A0A7S4UAX4_9DINO